MYYHSKTNLTDENHELFPFSQQALIIKNSVIQNITTHSVESADHEQMLLTEESRAVLMKFNYCTKCRLHQHYQQRPQEEISPQPVIRGVEIPPPKNQSRKISPPQICKLEYNTGEAH